MLKPPNNLTECNNTQCDECSRYLGYGERICDFRARWWKEARNNKDDSRNTVKGITNAAIRFDSPITIATQEPIELTPELIETIKTNCKTSYEKIIKDYGGELIKLGGGTTFDPCVEFTKLPDDVKAKLTDEIIKIIETNEAEKREKKED